jgi:Beta-galactosidase/beta-glucuronidase
VTTPVPIGNRVRTILPLDRNWLFNKGDASGAEGATFADSGWTKVSLPHDWAIEGPFASSAATTGRGGYAPSGIGWYRNHFTLPATVTSGQVYIEFDGVMSHATVYINGTQLGNHPYGYVSFRYDMTKNIKFGAENVLAVKTDTSSQPASRYYEGAGIYRLVRVIATDPVHVDQWATYVSTPSPTTASATVKVTTSVVNSGTAAQSVSVQGNVTDASGTALAPVTAPAQTIAAGASAAFAFDVPVTSPKLWSPDAPNMYQLVTTVQVGGKAVDDDVTPFGIRSLVFDGTTGLNINGKNVKMKGVCLHQDYHGLGLAAPARAMQRRIAALKGIGANAIRTAHDPPSPDFLDLCDRMGILVMDEFFDMWVAHKYSDTGDYATSFNKAATSPTGIPPVPGTATGALWYQVDVTGVVMRDRNHPSIALYSAGNEIRDSIGTRTPILTKMVSICHTLDPGRAVTQALFQPSGNGDITGATRTLLDVFGGNYRTAEVLQAMAMAPARAGVISEKGPDTATWTGDVMGNAALTGDFIWTGVDYLGEQDGGWPNIGGSGGLLDSLGNKRTGASAWVPVWGGTGTTVSNPAVSAGKVVLKADHDKITTDVNDASFVAAAVPSDTAVTFSIAGPGTILAVDSADSTQTTFRGNTRTASGGLAYAIVQATGAGTITVTASASGLTAGSATITATDGVWVPCSGTCD